MIEGLKPGRIVYFVLNEQQVAEITRRRTTGKSIADRMAIVSMGITGWPAGAQAHIGNEVRGGDICPAMVLKVWSTDSGCSNLKVMLDGSDEYWATSVNFDATKAPGTWHWMFDGQATRYEASKPQ
jgi:hypothetical protein